MGFPIWSVDYDHSINNSTFAQQFEHDGMSVA